MKISSYIICLAALLLATGCKKKETEIVLRDAAASVWDDGTTVGTQLELANEGTHTAQQLRLTSVEVQGGSYNGPTALPTASLGDLVPGHDIRFDAILKLSPVDGSAHRLTVKGDYHSGGK